MIERIDLMERMLSDEGQLSVGAAHEDWRVRYAAAVGMGESCDPAWLPSLLSMMRREETRDLYGQPRVAGFTDSYDDTRMAEQLLRIQVQWDREYPEERKEDWRCRGRVMQACLFAVEAIAAARGRQSVGEELGGYLHGLLNHGDSAVKAAAARALIRSGTAESLPHLRAALAEDDWCLQVEAKKAIRSIEHGTDA